MKRPMVLIVDDDRQLTALVQAFLQGAGVASETAFDPVQAFIKARREPPRVILLDLAMPAGGGMMLLERLKKTGGTREIPVIVMTALTEPQIEAEARAKGASAFLHKPLDRSSLISAIAAALKPLQT